MAMAKREKKKSKGVPAKRSGPGEGLDKSTQAVIRSKPPAAPSVKALQRTRRTR